MLKRLICAFCIFCIVVVGVGCGSDSSNTAQNNNHPKDGANISHNLKVVANWDNLQCGCGTRNGYYDSIMWPFDMYEEESDYIHISNILYTDYNSHQRVYLCNVPGCAHNNEDCTSYIKYSAGLYLFTDANEQYLFYVSTGAINGDATNDDEIGRIYRSNLDGSNRIELLKLDSTESFSYTGSVISDEDYIYYCVLAWDEETKTVGKVIKQISIETGETKDLLFFDNNHYMDSVTKDGHIVITDNTTPGNICFYLFSPYTGEMQKAYEWNNYASAQKDGLLFFTRLDGDTGYLKVVDLNNDSSSNTIGDIYTPADVGVMLWDCYEPYIHWSFFENNEHREYLINYRDGTVIESGLYYINTSYSQTYRIVADTEDRFLVIVGSNEKQTITQVDQNGIAHTYDYPDRPLYAMILKEDYWNNNPTYELIDDLI